MVRLIAQLKIRHLTLLIIPRRLDRCMRLWDSEVVAEHHWVKAERLIGWDPSIVVFNELYVSYGDWDR